MRTVTWFGLNKNTGEIGDMKNDFGFAKIDFKLLFDKCERLGHGECKVLLKMLSKMNFGNQVHGTYPELAQQAGVCESTVKLTIKKLRSWNLLIRESTSTYFVHPDLACRVSSEKRMMLLGSYKEISERQKKESYK